MVSILYFDGIHNEKKVNSKNNNWYCVSMIIYELILIISYNFLNNSGQKIVLIAIFLAGSLICFYTIHVLKPFNHPIVSKYFSTFTTMNTWTAIFMMMAYLIEKIIFNGLVIAWLISLPLVIVIILWSPLIKEKDSGNQ